LTHTFDYPQLHIVNTALVKTALGEGLMNIEITKIQINAFLQYKGQQGHAVAQLVEAVRYKPERRGFDSRWCHWNFSLT
jgi:hypothetical protein